MEVKREKYTDRYKKKETLRHTDINTHRETEKQGQTHRQTDIKTDRHYRQIKQRKGKR